MKLGAKINLVLILVTLVVLTAAFGIIVSIEANATRNQVLNNARVSTEIFHKEIERMFKQVYDQQVRLQDTVDELGKIKGVVYINVAGMDGVVTASTKNLMGTKLPERNISFIEEVKTKRQKVKALKDKGTFYELEQWIPIYKIYSDDNSEIINVIEVEVATDSKSSSDIAQAESLLLAISASVEQTARSIIVTREEDLEAIRLITESVANFGLEKEDGKGRIFHDFIVSDANLNIIANTDKDDREFDDDTAEHNKYRNDVLSGKIEVADYKSVVHGEHEVMINVRPIKFMVEGRDKIIGLQEVHILTSSYTDKITALKLRMFGLGIVFTAVFVMVLSAILEREVVGPIRRYSVIAKKIADGDLTQVVEHTTNDEIGQFGAVFNSMVVNLRELDKLKSDFISVAAHQLRTPLSGVKWVLKLLLDGDLGAVTEDQKGMLKRGFETNEKMIQLVNDLLNVSRIENGKFGYNFVKNDFIKLLNTLIENTVLPSKERNIEVRLENRIGEIPEFLFDPEKLLIALQNIVDNAMKYTLPGGKVTIIVQRQGDYIEVKISDTGVGIPQADLAKLFSKFFRASNVIHLQTDGSGLGLFIVKSIIMRHGGQIWVDSVEGKGTTFTVVIPVVANLLPKEDEEGRTVELTEGDSNAKTS
ncbi:MAG: Multi-sensor signal transduction histidine kinase [Parcubacteria group bacterium GW2011_GWC1_42_11]|uniref:histidine kinase n=1 Tax=Candidatus Nomurabacteria bacterium GW2011_GWC2_42_20 TaxID=1618756 RepID=A0A0G0ZHM1_9BACT|nr:MAG: Multi-sensor signal transduction histidine kinase [Parcubacteria group bacterium GW2011_GWC1_42_11]KKS48225.1 MAG: Integral membrane sensor signal transduction histidine kinase [Candidatus Nomurabacteria bacterium GW2011_GWC2_42_20]KKS59355.1 MAG: Integral membrane sensor signal transduction histidine kinase [Candidatus Nomurabacteria bacterium GW2011_GWA2_42_41]KKT09798.1 MAG: Integral membrane sensor signal transduction histidine kinase [Candidatus Nomurabacteria bacterium GW2011_GWB1_